MKVLIDGLCLQQSGLGIRRYTNYLIDSYIKRYGRENVKVIISKVTGDEFYDYILYKGSKRYVVKFFTFYYFLKNIEFDLFHSPANLNYLRKIKGKFYVLTMHDIMYRVVPLFYTKNRFFNFIKVRMSDIYTYVALKNSDMVLTISETTKMDVLHYFGKDSIVIPNGVDVLISDLKDESILKTYGLRERSYFLYVGSNKHHKNLTFLIEAFLKSHTDKRLVLCGAKIDVLSEYENRIIVTGHVKDQDLAVLYANCEAYIFPSLYEGFGLPILEALSLGAKVYSSTGGALKEFPKTIITFFDPTKKEELISLIEKTDEIDINKSEVENFLANYNWKDVLNRSQSVIADRYQHFNS